ncbi:hypothetical protein JT06_09960 [Desulfobulbus sp. Tol-SR]|jgi:hypothetical protein|nr:hypothetical protein JT06_09960 [Desulfobulbus sp. Tol-SR]
MDDKPNLEMEGCTDHQLMERYREINREILQLLNDPGDISNSIRKVLDLLKKRTGFDAVGIRLRSEDDFPFQAQRGFSQDFLLHENTLIERTEDGGICRDPDGEVRLECTCGLVISGKTNPASPFSPREAASGSTIRRRFSTFPPKQTLDITPATAASITTMPPWRWCPFATRKGLSA